MKFISLADHQYIRNFIEAVKEGPAPNGSLFFPAEIPQLGKSFFEALPKLSLQEIAFEVMKPYTQSDISEQILGDIVKNVFSFPIPAVKIEDDIFSLELFHGPTQAFKDVGAGFLAQVLKYTTKNEKIRILVATSGDTGGAVANAFYGLENVDIFVLYPKNKVSELQQKQFAGLGKNIKALRVDGTFDDCQHLVKTAFADDEISSKLNLSSANSINIARWIPQSIYYYWAAAQLNSKTPLTICVPSGNIGNISSAVLAHKTGLSIDQFISASNANNVVPAYLETGNYEPKATIQTLANAMDVGAPNNFIRLLELYNNDYQSIKSHIQGVSYKDDEILKGIEKLHKNTNYLADPHGITAYMALKKLKKQGNAGVFVETASYGKFIETVEKALGKKVKLPQELKKIENREINYSDLSTNYNEFKEFLIKNK